MNLYFAIVLVGAMVTVDQIIRHICTLKLARIQADVLKSGALDSSDITFTPDFD